MKKLKAFVKKVLPFHIHSNELFRLNKQYGAYLKLNKKYKKIIDGANYELDKNETKSNYVWVAWLTGYENAPKIVKSCYESLKNHFKNKEIIFLTSENLSDYIEIPDYIMEKLDKKIISWTHFSDIIRIYLLAKYGGTWVDATVFATDDIPKFIDEENFFVFSNEFRGDDSCLISSWFITCVKNHPIILLTRDLLEEYWKKNNKLKNYFLLHLFMTMAMRKYSSLLEDMPFVSNINPHVFQFKYLFKSYSDKDYELIKNSCFVHKLSYKFHDTQNLTGTFYNAVIDGKLK